MASNVITDIDSKTKATSRFAFTDILFVVAYLLIIFMFRGYVHIAVQVPYFIFSLLCAVFLVLPSKSNQGRSNLAALFILLNKDDSTYKTYIERTVKNNE